MTTRTINPQSLFTTHLLGGAHSGREWADLAIVRLRKTVVGWIGLAVWFSGTALVADQPSESVDRDGVLERVDELDASEASKRRSAEQWLLEAGPDALPFLPETSDVRSEEANQRLAKVRSSLQAMKAERELADIKVYLDEVKTLGEALEAISRDSGVEFDFAGDKSVAVDSVATPLAFWHALDLVLDQTDLDVNFYGGDRETLMLQTRMNGRPDRVQSGAYISVYRIEPTSVTARRVLNQPSLSGLNIHLEIAWEPRVTPIGLTVPVDQVVATLDSGGLLRPQGTSDTIDVATSRDIAFSEFFLPMELPGGSPQKIKRLAGVLKALLPGKKQRFELDLVGGESMLTKDAMTVEIEQNRPNGSLHEIRVGVQLENPDRSLESHRQWIFNNEVFVVGSDGARIDHLGYQVYRQATDGVGIGYLFDLGDDFSDAKLVYVSPTTVVNSEVPFVLADIPLP